MLKKGQLFKAWQLSAAISVTLLAGVTMTPKAMADLDQVETQPQAVTDIVSQPTSAKSDTEAVAILSGEEIPDFIAPSSYSAIDLVPQENLLAQRPLDLDEFCETYPFNSRCLNRDLETEEELEIEEEVSEPDFVDEESNVDYSHQGWYISVSGAWQQREQASEVDEDNTFLDFDSGLGVNGAVGYRVNNFRLEGEFSFLSNGVDEASATIPFQFGLAPAPAEGSVNLYSYMVNGYYDIPIENSGLKPYVGGGLGFYVSEINGLFAENFFPIAGIPPVNATSDPSFAFQLRAGLGYRVSKDVEAFIGYRYFWGDELTFSAEGLGTFHPNGARVHNVELGIRALL